MVSAAVAVAHGVQARPCEDTRKRGLFTPSGRPLPKGAVVFAEEPWALTQTLASRERVPACTHCLRPLGPLTLHVRAQTAGGLKQPLASLPPLPELPTPAGPEAPLSLGCPHGCDACFCSVRCRDAAVTGWHDLLCTGRCIGDAHPLKEFARHAAQTNELFLLGGRALCGALAEARAAGGTSEAVQAATDKLQARGAPCTHACAPACMRSQFARADAPLPWRAASEHARRVVGSVGDCARRQGRRRADGARPGCCDSASAAHAARAGGGVARAARGGAEARVQAHRRGLRAAAVPGAALR